MITKRKSVGIGKILNNWVNNYCCYEFFRFCDKSFSYGFSSKKGVKKYDRDVLKNEFLISSSQTAFTVSYLYMTTLLIFHSNSSFQGLADIYNSFHSFNKHDRYREDLNRKRLCSGWHLYVFLELCSRYGVTPIFKEGEGWLEDSINKNYNQLKFIFSTKWASHSCDVPHCKTMMVTDGGMKINRPVCAAKFSVIREFKFSNKRVLTGCTNMPSSIGGKFCADHMNSETPVLLKESLSKSTQEKLHVSRKRTKKTNLLLPDDEVFTVETILGFKKKDNVDYFHIKWAGFDKSEATWEPRINVPSFILRFYEKPGNFGKPLPKPRIEKTKQVADGSEVFHFLKWGEEDSGEWISECLFELDADSVVEEISTCNTRKIKEKRDRRHTCGVLISCKPCGICPHWDELFGSESITQVIYLRQFICNRIF